nr:hypothetical protein BaRGS_029349 [Batillaria attramentaria]
MSDSNSLFFFQQTKFRTTPKRFRKHPEDLPESLKFAHLNPKVAAYLASKEKQKQEEDLFGDGLGKKSLMPEINQAFMSIKNRLDSSLSNDEDSQRYLFEEARINSGTVLMQLAKIIYSYDDIASHIPKSLEYQLMCGVKELTSDVIIIHREWQTYAMKEAHAKMMASTAETHSDDDDTGGQGSYGERREIDPRTVTTAMANPSYYMSVIQFQLSSKICEEKGWIVQKGREDELAKEAVLEWCVQILQQARKVINDQKAQEKEMGYDQPVQVRYYGDSRKETLLKYRKSPVKPSINPAVQGRKTQDPKHERMNKQLAELVKSVDTQDKSLYDIEADKELARLQRKTSTTSPTVKFDRSAEAAQASIDETGDEKELAMSSVSLAKFSE